MKYKLYNNSKIVFETPDESSYFFGYYDKCPLSKRGDKLLSHKVNFDGRDVTADDYAEVGYWDLNTKEFHKIGTTWAFNWQQGSHLQWLPPDYESKVIYNDRRNNKFVCVIYDLKTKKEKVLNSSIYAIHPSGKFALAVNYERLYFCRPGYNYKGIVRKKWDKPYHKDDGIFKVDLSTGEVEQLISTKDIVEMQPTEEILQNNNWLEHMMWNPSGNRFLFMHRWSNEKNEQKTRLFTCDEKGKNIQMYPDTGFYSHMCWKNDNELTIYAKIPAKSDSGCKPNKLLGPLKRLASVILTNKMKKEIVNKISPKAFLSFTSPSQFNIVGKNKLNADGHCTWSKHQNMLLSDTYQDEKNFRHLYLYNNPSDRVLNIGRFYSNYNDNEYRCDLHPRFSHDEKSIVIDSAHRKKRAQVIIGIQNEHTKF